MVQGKAAIRCICAVYHCSGIVDTVLYSNTMVVFGRYFEHYHKRVWFSRIHQMHCGSDNSDTSVSQRRWIHRHLLPYLRKYGAAPVLATTGLTFVSLFTGTSVFLQIFRKVVILKLLRTFNRLWIKSRLEKMVICRKLYEKDCWSLCPGGMRWATDVVRVVRRSNEYSNFACKDWRKLNWSVLEYLITKSFAVLVLLE